MTCIIANLPGGIAEIFPIPIKMLEDFRTAAAQAMDSMIERDKLPVPVADYVGAALRPDRSPFYLYTVAPDLVPSLRSPRWQGGFYAPFGVGEVVGSVEANLSELPKVIIEVRARLVVNGKDQVNVEWQVVGSQDSAPNKSALIVAVIIHNAGPHDAADIRRCVALHAPQRVFGEPKAIVAMQCGVAAACLVEAIC